MTDNLIKQDWLSRGMFCAILGSMCNNSKIQIFMYIVSAITIVAAIVMEISGLKK